MARKLKYGEETVLFAKKVPKSKLSKVEDLVDKFLGTVEMDTIKKRNDFKSAEKAFKEVLKDPKLSSQIENVQKDLVLTGFSSTQKIFVPRQDNEGGSPPEIAVEAPKLQIQDSTGFIAYPCGCMYDGKLNKVAGCLYGGYHSHKIFFGNE